MSSPDSNLPAPSFNSGGQVPELGSFEFHGDLVTVVTTETGNWAVLGQLCQNLTLDPNGQRQAIERKSWSRGKTCVTHVQLPGDTQARPQFLIHERIVPMWLANITASRIKDEIIKGRIETAQVELADALYEYASRRHPSRPEPTKLELAKDLVAVLEAKEALEAANRVLMPKASKWEALCNSEGLIDMNAAAKAFRDFTGGLGRTKFMDMLRSDDVQFLQVQNPRIPYEQHVKAARAEVKFVRAGRIVVEQTFFTAKGMDWLADRLGIGTAALAIAS
ncbi:phage antirepressor KilAC domain-containing protein [Streptacidiphilus sp. EB129]|uniref:phage antirepressor KilAC domain-containing protein n=1 Tax=Streptacidiphilus sp. EB129 TaxID=3156262 RepID=UPI003510FACD